MKLKTTFLLSVLFLLPFTTIAQDGSLDTSFGTGGVVTTIVGAVDFLNLAGNAYPIAIQNDGKIVVAGKSYNGFNYDFGVVRYNGNGSLDTSFGTNGKVITDFGNDFPKSIAIQSDGKILVGGVNFSGSTVKFALVRYTTNGSLDTTFDTDGKVTTNFSGGDCHAYSLALQSDGKIVLAGDGRDGSGFLSFATIRYNTDGSLDTTFGTNGKVATYFGTAGATSDTANAVAIQNDGKIVVAGLSNLQATNISRFAALRYNTDGSLDTSFDNDGMLTASFGAFSDEATSLALQNDGKLVIGGNSSLAQNGGKIFAIARFNSDGSLDTTFDSDGKVTTLIGTSSNGLYSTILQGDGKILVAGFSNSLNGNVLTIVRYNIDGSLDTSFDSDGIVNTIYDFAAYTGLYALALQNDGKIVAAGRLNNYFGVVRYNNASLATTTFENQTVTISVAPNPFSSQTTFQSDVSFENASLSVYNSIGQLVKAINNINGQQITFSRDNLPNGLYFAHLMQDNKSIGSQKLVITE
ncbi:T9SS type A sorting domain-containing protein [Flavobacterium wongokense]|uniref:T9SS type A sorting domain-containing protein n=1 Tax=Flavobacterium wongokense TaxID=2910674 RepID=UPI001F19B760|nr:T9SS type A sorting domain-containing protein [Flavobacterium sp. WG47]MCF6133433.1 T9SS type A sorting domain-containing protein [Flavobacterium sp. WG47]